MRARTTMTGLALTAGLALKVKPTKGYGGSTDQGLACNMTGGSSGGGWIQNGSLSSVTSLGYTGVKNILWGPYFGSTIQAVYNTAASTP